MRVVLTVVFALGGRCGGPARLAAPDARGVIAMHCCRTALAAFMRSRGESIWLSTG
jgi:hypothetical protein